MSVSDLKSFVLRNVLYASRKNCWLVAIIALATALITGALMLGTSVRQSLRDAAVARTGDVQWAMMPQNQWFSGDLPSRVQAPANAIVQVKAFAYGADGVPVLVNLYGVDDEFFSFVYGVEQPLTSALASSDSLKRLGLNEGANLVLRLAQGSHFAEGLSWSLNEQEMVGLRIPVKSAEQGMGFQLSSGQQQGVNVFVPKEVLLQKLEREAGGNVLLVKGEPLLMGAPRLEDYGLQLKHLESGSWELSSSQTFIPEALGVALDALDVPQERIFTYFVNSVSSGGKSTPYSFIAGMSKPLGEALRGDECSITQWLAEDLDVSAGAVLDITYFEIQAQGELKTATSQLVVEDVIATGDRRDLTPPFPGFTDSDSCNDWDPSIPVDTESIRKKDELYWEEYQGSPKLFVSLEKAQALFGSASGQLSAVRFSGDCRDEMERVLAEHLSLFQNIPLQDINEQGTEQSMDFSGLFFALSFFVIAAAVILLVMITVLRMEAKRHELALLQSLGYTARQLKAMLMGEFALYVLVGCALGCLLALGYVAAILALLNSVWNSVSGYSVIEFHVALGDFLWGFGLSACICLLSIYGLARRFLRSGLQGGLQRDFSVRHWSRVDRLQVLLLSVLCAVCYVVAGEDVALFFAASFLLLLLGFKGVKYFLCLASRMGLSLYGLAFRNLARHLSRSMAIVCVFSLGLFICLLTIVNHRSMGDEQDVRSGTGGYYGMLETAVPIRHDLNSADGRQEYGLSEGMHFAQLRRVDGSQAGCLNLNRVVRPQLLGVPASAVAGRFGFVDGSASWDLLEADLDGGVIPVVADAEVIQWSLGLKLGDELEYVAEGGRSFRLRFVAGLNKSIFQGYVLVSDANLARMYPSLGGSEMLLIGFDAKDRLAGVSRALERKGVFFTSAADRLNLFNEVQNSYLMIFFVLGTIGLVMAIVGFVLLVQYELLQRQGEFGVLACVGYGVKDVARLIVVENGVLLLAALVVAVLALLPLGALRVIDPPFGVMLGALVLVSGCACVGLWVLARRWNSARFQRGE